MKKQYIYVEFAETNRLYTYRCNFRVKVGDLVRVPAGEDKVKVAVVGDIRRLDESQLTFPPEKAKDAIEIVKDKNEIKAFYDSAPRLPRPKNI